MITEYLIANTFEELLIHVEKCMKITKKGKNFPVLFRGHSDKDSLSYPLLPKIHRKEYSDKEKYRELHLAGSFYVKAKALMQNAPRSKDYLFWITRMQHYGLPTRLLDWTKSLLVALFFAVKNERKHGIDGCIWMLNPNALNKKMKHYEGIFPMVSRDCQNYLVPAFHREPKFNLLTPSTKGGKEIENGIDEYFEKKPVIACWAEENDLRMMMQQSAFTIHALPKSLEELIDDEDEILYKIIIPYKKKPTLLQQLEICGISVIDVFPDIETLAKLLDKGFSFT